jgi:hypothetical protein
MPKRSAYPEGPKLQMTAEWKKLVRDEMERRNVGPKWVADRLGLKTHAGVSKMIDPKRNQQTSALVMPICALFNLPLPLEPSLSAEDSALLDRIRRLPPGLKAATTAYLDSISSEQGEPRKR